MTYTHLPPNELVMIEAYYQEGATVRAIVASLGRSKQTILLCLKIPKKSSA